MRRQIGHVEEHGGKIILMASRALCRVAKGPDDYLAVYGRLIRQCRGKVILHWLGEMFDPALAGYWGSRDFEPAMETVLTLIRENADKIDGIKISLLDAGKEITMRQRPPAGVVMYTGDDFNYAELIGGDDRSRCTACSASSIRSRRLPPRPSLGWRRVTAPASTPFSIRPSRSRAGSSRHRPSITNAASFSRLAQRLPEPFPHGGRCGPARGILHYADLFRPRGPVGAADRSRTGGAGWSTCAAHRVA